MAKTSYITIPPGLDTAYKKTLQSGDRFINPHVKVKRLFTSRAKKKGLTQKSLMVSLAPVWAGFDLTTKTAWENAALENSMTGWRLFIQDTAKRIANDLPGYATPNTLYQSMVGRMHVESPAIGLKILQLHPQSYYVNRKVTGTRSEYEPVLIQENLSLPVDIAISYKSDLTAVDGEAFARFYIIIYSSYQGKTLENRCTIDFDLSHDWERLTASVDGVIGLFRGYTAFVEINHAQGDLYFDNVEIVHDGQNWARDPFCNSIQTTFTKAFYQIPRNWAAEVLTDGMFYRSVYHGTIS